MAEAAARARLQRAISVVAMHFLKVCNTEDVEAATLHVDPKTLRKYLCEYIELACSVVLRKLAIAVFVALPARLLFSASVEVESLYFSG